MRRHPYLQAPKCPKLKSTEKAQNGNPKAENGEDKFKRRARAPLEVCKKVRPEDITKPLIDDKKKKKLMFGTKYKDHSSGEKGIFNLNQFDKDHKDNLKRQQPEANLTIVETDVPVRPPVVTTLEPEEDMDLDEIISRTSGSSKLISFPPTVDRLSNQIQSFVRVHVLYVYVPKTFQCFSLIMQSFHRCC
jgi:hypothetical protein